MHREVKAEAELSHRTVQDEYRFLISLALQLLRSGVEGISVERRRSVPQFDGEQIMPAPPMAARSRTETRTRRTA
jgi:hypothetical protein